VEALIIILLLIKQRLKK